MGTYTNKIIKATIEREKKEKNAIILAHNYQPLEIQEVADFVGDSLELAQKAAQTKAEMIVFCGVQFMAETAKLLKPNAKVLLSVKDAGCPMADMITAKQLTEFKNKNKNSVVVCYVNSSVEVKAGSSICCTSSNAVKIIKSIPKDKKILFVPDQNLGSYAAQIAGRKVVVWKGFCNVHHNHISVNDVVEMKKQYPDYTLIVHPECKPEVCNLADEVGSTKQIADYVEKNDKVIIGTEMGMVEQLINKYPDKELVGLSEKAICGNMKKTTLKELMLTMLEDRNEIVIPEKIAKKALVAVKKMLDLSK